MAVRTHKKKIGYSPSVNIIRDSVSELNYIPTPNSKQVFNQFINDYKTGIRSFSIVGAYGTGKSSFLWAFNRNLNQVQNYFAPVTKTFRSLNGFELLPFVGEYASMIEVIANKLGVKHKNYTSTDVINALNKHYNGLHKTSKGLLLMVDEFGKFLEYAAKNNPEKELYFIQQLAEYVNDENKSIFFITTLHQDFNGYARSLTKTQQNEWDKVKGRLKEITFNEPVEQLLFLASERLAELNFGSKDKYFAKLFECINLSKAFPLKDFFSKEFAEKLIPFDILSAAILTLALQKYGQNERSLFSFIESNDPNSIRDFTSQGIPYYNVSSVYDYLIHHYYSFLTTKYNPHYTQWSAIRSAIERAEGLIEVRTADAVKIVKTIGLLNIFASASARLGQAFLSDYSKYSLGVGQPEIIIKQLEGLKIIRYVKHSNKYILFEGTDLDIELAIDEAGNLVERVSEVVRYLNQYFEFPYIPVKAAYYEKGTPRYFAFHLSEVPVGPHPVNEIDGYVNLVFSDTLKENDIKGASKASTEAVLFGWYKNTHEIRNLIFEIEKVKKVRENHINDKVAVRELESILQHQIKLLNHLVMGNIYSQGSPIVWYFQGKEVSITNQKSFNRLLSTICRTIYPGTPIYRNEMVNKTRISGAIATARKSFLKAMVENWSEPDMGFDANRFPPEKTIYLSLLRETGIHRQEKDGYNLGEPTNTKFHFTALWDECIDYLHRSRQGKRNLNELVSILQSAPYKLKKGFIDFWLPIFLFIKRNDFAIFDKEGIYIPYLSDESLDLIVRAPGEYSIKAFDIEGVRLSVFNRYRSLLNQKNESKPGKLSFIETIRPFLTFHRQLPGYARQTKRLDKRTIALRDAIEFSTDPEETFFEKFPVAMGYSLKQLEKSKAELEEYSRQLESCIKELRTSYDNLVKRFETYLIQDIVGEVIEFPNYKIALQSRFARLKKHLLLPNQKVFYQRIMSELDDRKSWLNSITQACIGKTLDESNDDDEIILYEKFTDIIHELDNLCDISKNGFDETKEIAFKLEVTSFVEGLQKNLVRIPKTKNKQLLQLHAKMKAQLSSDRHLNIATLAKLLEEILKNEK